jgi:DNA-binding response OmpR family regulator
MVKALIIEDDPNAAQLIASRVSLLAGEVKILATMAEAIGYIEASTEPPEIVTIDLALPDSGRAETIEKISRIRARAPESLLIVITGLSVAEDTAKCIERGADGVFDKIDMDSTFMEKLRALVLAVQKKAKNTETSLKILEAISSHMRAQARVQAP